MDLRAKYNEAVQTAKRLGFQGAATQQEEKLYFKGAVRSEDERNQIWDAIKTVPDWKSEIIADIAVIRIEQPVGTSGKTYTVKAGDTLSKIAREQLGDANAYMRIFNANKDLLTNPDKIKPGQVLKLPV